jgi:hypothetical protein
MEALLDKQHQNVYQVIMFRIPILLDFVMGTLIMQIVINTKLKNKGNFSWL